jgi:serine protease
MRVQTNPTSGSGNAGFLYLVLFDLEMNNSGQLELSPVDGVYDFKMTGIEAGDYYLIGGSDVDNDGYICEVGESCGAYPVYGQSEVITADRNISGLDFLATINSGLSSSSITSLVMPAQGLPINPKADKNRKGVVQ